MEWDTYVNIVNKNKAEADKSEAERRARSGFYENVKSDFGVVRNWD